MSRWRVPERYSLSYGNSIFTGERYSRECQAVAFNIMDFIRPGGVVRFRTPLGCRIALTATQVVDVRGFRSSGIAH